MEPDDQQTDQKPQIIKPDDMFQPSVPPHKTEPAPAQEQTPPPSQPDFDDGSAKRKKIIIIAGSVISVFFILIVVVILLSSGGNSGNQNQQEQNAQSGILVEPTAIDIENANNSITSDITSLNDDVDYPSANLTNDNLDL
ncbi:MAG TPA: hypothetical protein VFK11_03680 [Candidatus Saccharimonadales bacterium]|nr:hypothetical protein [Candidatus Saccharimonadales bacterium]